MLPLNKYESHVQKECQKKDMIVEQEHIIDEEKFSIGQQQTTPRTDVTDCHHGDKQDSPVLTSVPNSPKVESQLYPNKASSMKRKGILNYPNGDVYEGEMRGDVREGFGVLIQHGRRGRNCTEKYEGNWIADRFDGQGSVHYSDGGSYQGAWSGFKRHGFGVEVSTTGNLTYMGDFKSNQKNGRGMARYSDGGMYDGQWMDGRQCGQGVLWARGMLYRGEFLEGRKHGRGVAELADGRLSVEIWEKGRHVESRVV